MTDDRQRCKKEEDEEELLKRAFSSVTELSAMSCFPFGFSVLFEQFWCIFIVQFCIPSPAQQKSVELIVFLT